MRFVSISGIVCLCLVLCQAGATAQEADYALSPWACGVIVWPGRIPEYAQPFSHRLTRAASAAFGYWGYEVPVASDTPFDETLAIRIYDPATRTEWVVPPLDWSGRATLPVVVFAFSGEAELRSAMGDSTLYAAFWYPWPMDEGAFPNAERWIWRVGAGHRNLACATSAEDETLIHECAHWFTYQWCLAHGVVPQALPSYVTEGIAEMTCAANVDPNDDVYDRLGARAWAEAHCLSENIQGVMRYVVGKSLIGYLIGRLGTNGFLDTLTDWSTRVWEAIDLYEPGWRESLGLPADCPSSTTNQGSSVRHGLWG